MSVVSVNVTVADNVTISVNDTATMTARARLGASARARVTTGFCCGAALQVTGTTTLSNVSSEAVYKLYDLAGMAISSGLAAPVITFTNCEQVHAAATEAPRVRWLFSCRAPWRASGRGETSASSSSP